MPKTLDTEIECYAARVSALIRSSMQAGFVPQSDGFGDMKFSVHVLDEHVEVVIDEARKQGILPSTLESDGKGTIRRLCQEQDAMEPFARYLLRCSVAKRIEKMTGRKAKFHPSIDATIEADADAWHEHPRRLVSLVRQQFTAMAQERTWGDLLCVVSLCERATKAAEQVDDADILHLLKIRDDTQRLMNMGKAPGTEIDALCQFAEGLEAVVGARNIKSSTITPGRST